MNEGAGTAAVERPPDSPEPVAGGRSPGRRGKLYFRFLAISVPVQAAILIAMTMIFYSSQSAASEEELTAGWNRTARHVLVVLTQNLAGANYDDAEQFLEGLAGEPDVLDCTLYDEGSERLFGTTRPGIAAPPVPAGLVASARDRRVNTYAHDPGTAVAHVAVPIMVGNRVKGIAVIALSTAAQEARVAALRERLFLATAAFALAGVIVTIALAGYVARPVSKLAVAAGRLAAGDYNLSVGTGRGDEIGALAAAFDSMVVNLRAAHDDLSVARADVEKILESMPDAVLVVECPPGGDLVIARANVAAATLLGWDRPELEGCPLATVVRDVAGLRTALFALDAAGQVRDRDTVYLRRSGGNLDVRLSASRMPGADVVESYVLVASDVSEARRAERRRVAAYRLSELIPSVGAVPDLVRGVESVLRTAIRFDAMHTVMADPESGHDASPRADESHGGISAFALQAEGAIVLNAEQVRLLVRRGEIAEAAAVPEHWVSVPLRADGRVWGLLAVLSNDPRGAFSQADVDLLVFAGEQMSMALRRRRAEEERTRLATAVEHAVDAILILDGDGRVVYVNPAYERQSGFGRAEIAHRRFDEIWNRGSPDASQSAMWTAVRSGTPWSGPITGTRRNGSAYHVDTTISAVRDASGRVVEFVVVQHDVSEVRTLEEQLRQSQKMEAVGLLAGGVAHDFNNLLSVILGYGELIRPKLRDAEAVAHLDVMTQAGERATSLVGQLLAFSRRRVIEPRPLDLRVAVGDMQKMLRRIIREDIEFAAELPATLDLVQADPGQIEQLLMNLAVNARDAMPKGGRLTIHLEDCVLDESGVRAAPGLQPGRHVALLFSDTGVGMTPEVRDRAFEPFFTTKARGQGTGLGLSTVYGIVQQARGHVTIETELGRGTTFRIFFPSTGQVVAPAAPAPSPELEAPGSETILVVEDEPALRSFAVCILTARGYKVIEAPDGLSAVEISRKHAGTIDLLLTDVVMPRMNGTTLAETLQVERPGMGVLYMSGYTDGALTDRGVLDADVELIQKPFTSAKLLQRVRRRLDDLAVRGRY